MATSQLLSWQQRISFQTGSESAFTLLRPDGAPFCGLRMPGRFGATSDPYWYHLDREPGLPEPLRTLSLAFVPFVAMLMKACRHQ